jgi:hypothetical protein
MQDVIQAVAMTTLQAAKDTARATYTKGCTDTNAALIQAYTQAFNSALAACATPPTDYTGLPPVPASFVVVDIVPPESVTGAWPTPMQSGPPVCAPLPLPVDMVMHYSATAKIGQPMFGGKRFFQKVDQLPATTEPFPGQAADGTTGFFMGHIEFGNLGYYEKVS